MAEPTRPAQRQVPCRIFTPAGFLMGTLHVPQEQTLIDFLNGTGHFLTLTAVTLPGQSQPLSFFALARSSAVLVIPATDELVVDEERSSIRSSLHQVSCLFQGGLLMGTLALPEDVRVSDELMAARGFLLMNHCTLGVDAGGQSNANDSGSAPSMQAANFVIVHASHIIGVAEM